MFSYRKIYETPEQKIEACKKSIKFYKKNSDARFQTKGNLEGISEDIDSEMNKSQTDSEMNKKQTDSEMKKRQKLINENLY